MSKKIFIDAGHGGTDSGATGYGLKEKDITLAVASRVAYHLKRHNLDVKMSRSADSTVSLGTRTSQANSWGADFFLSIHCNASTGTAYGYESFIYKTLTTASGSYKYQKAIDDAVRSDATLFTKHRGMKTADYHVLRESKMDAVLVECAFIDHAGDNKILQTKQEGFAVAYAKGILKALGLTWKAEAVNVAPTTKQTFYRVVAGSFTDKATAQKRADEVKAKAGIECFLVAYQQ